MTKLVSLFAVLALVAFSGCASAFSHAQIAVDASAVAVAGLCADEALPVEACGQAQVSFHVAQDALDAARAADGDQRDQLVEKALKAVDDVAALVKAFKKAPKASDEADAGAE